MRILFCILNWGIGHVSRSAVVIQSLLDKGYHVTLASDGEGLAFATGLFPQLPVKPLPGYNIRYASRGMPYSLISHLPRILQVIRKENRCVGQWVEKQPYDYIISDGRFGCRHPDIPSVLINHQLYPVWPWWPERIQKRFRRLLEGFHMIWVPDDGQIKLSGRLCKDDQLQCPVQFIGPLSRLDVVPRKAPPEEEKPLLILSGPPASRLRFAKSVAKALGQAGIPFNTVGRPGDIMHSAGQLSREIAAASVVIARSGYSSIMDMCRLRHPAVLIPTPGQTEQEYLSERLDAKNWCTTLEETDWRELPDRLQQTIQGWPDIAYFQPDKIDTLLP